MAGGTFESMSHERMLAWLDQANSGTVQRAADRLAKVAEEIHKIADELKIRPQLVEWKGEGADAFRTWTADLANSTLRLGDFSAESAKWLAEASGAIARTQAAIPRTQEGAEGNLVAAASAPNDPDSATISSKSSDELAALAAGKEKVRQEAAYEMIKLGQAYEFSAVQLNALERPKFPPPPEVLVPDGRENIEGGAVFVSPGGSAQSATSGSEPTTVDSRRNLDSASDVRRVSGGSERPPVSPLEDAPSTRLGIDSVGTLLPDKQTPTGPVTGPPGPGRPDGSGPSTPHGWIPSLPGTPPGGPPAQGRSGVTGRVPQPPGPMGPSPNTGRVPGGTSIIGGRPVVPPLGGQQTGVPHRGTVVGAPGPTGGRTPMGPAAGTTPPAGRVAGQYGHTLNHRPAPSHGGVIGGNPQRTGRVSPGSGGVIGTGPTAGATPPGSTASPTVRGGVVGGTPATAHSGENRGTDARRMPRSNSSTDSAGRNGQSRRSAADEGTQRRGNGPNVPPAID